MIRIESRQLPNDTASFILDGTSYKINTQWNDREQAWYASIYQGDDTPLLLGRKMLQTANLTHRHGLVNFIDGDFYFVNTKTNQTRPEFTDLGVSCYIAYFTEAESLLIRSTPELSAIAIYE